MESYLYRLYDEAMEGEEEKGSFEQDTFLENTVDEIRLGMINVSLLQKYVHMHLLLVPEWLFRNPAEI